jgi:hypothetical protein
MAVAVALLCSPVLAASSSSNAIPDLSAGGAAWRNTHNDFILPKTGAGPVTWTRRIPISGTATAGRPRRGWPI